MKADCVWGNTFRIAVQVLNTVDGGLSLDYNLSTGQDNFMEKDEEQQLTDFKKAFGEAVRELRNKTGVSQEQFAHDAGIDRSYMGAIERGTKNVTIKNIVKIANALSKKPSEILKQTEKKLRDE